MSHDHPHEKDATYDWCTGLMADSDKGLGVREGVLYTGDSRGRFETWTDEELGDAAYAFDSAAGEGVCISEDLVKALVEEAKRRTIKLPFAYSGEADPDGWIQGSHFYA